MAADRIRHDIESLEPYFRYVLVKDETVKLCKYSRVGTLDSNSTDRPRPLKIILSSIEEKQLLLIRKTMLPSVMPGYFSSGLQQKV